MFLPGCLAAGRGHAWNAGSLLSLRRVSQNGCDREEDYGRDHQRGEAARDTNGFHITFL